MGGATRAVPAVDIAAAGVPTDDPGSRPVSVSSNRFFDEAIGLVGAVAGVAVATSTGAFTTDAGVRAVYCGKGSTADVAARG